LRILFFIKTYLSFGANCPLLFAIAIPAFGSISSLRCEDTASIGADGLVIFLFGHCERNAVKRGNLFMFVHFCLSVMFTYAQNLDYKSAPFIVVHNREI
jgi:hypothetical protein